MSSPEDRIKITYLNLVNDPQSPVIAIFGCHEVKRDFYMAKLKIISKKDGSVFIAMPNEKFTDPRTGQDAYSNFFWYGPKNAQIFQETCLESIKSYCLRKGITHPSLVDCMAKEAHSDRSVFSSSVSNPEFSGAECPF